MLAAMRMGRSPIRRSEEDRQGKGFGLHHVAQDGDRVVWYFGPFIESRRRGGLRIDNSVGVMDLSKIDGAPYSALGRPRKVNRYLDLNSILEIVPQLTSMAAKC